MEFLAQFVGILAKVLYIALLARVVLSWINLGSDNPFVTIVYQITEPILAPIRRVLPAFGTLDLSPMVAMLAVWIVSQVFQRLV